MRQFGISQRGKVVKHISLYPFWYHVIPCVYIEWVSRHKSGTVLGSLHPLFLWQNFWPRGRNSAAIRVKTLPRHRQLRTPRLEVFHAMAYVEDRRELLPSHARAVQGCASGAMALKVAPLRNQQRQVTQIQRQTFWFCREFMHTLYS